MSQSPNGAPHGVDQVDQIEAEIARTREELAGTVDELGARLDVKTRAREGVAEAKTHATAALGDAAAQARHATLDGRGRPRPVALVVAGLAAAALGATAVFWRKRR